MSGRRILHVDSGRTFRGGQRQVRLLAAAQAAGPDELLLLTANGRLRTRAESDGVPCIKWWGPARGLLQLGSAMRRFRPDIVHVHDSRAHGAVRLVNAGRPLHLVVHRRIDDPLRDRAATRWKYRHGVVIAVSEAVAAVVRSYGVPSDRLCVVPSAVSCPPDPPARTAPSHPLRLLALGALVPHKGHEVLLDALARTHGDHGLVLAGAGPLRSRLEQQARALGIVDRVHFSGDVGEGAALFDAADLFVHPSRTEGLGTAVLDAMAAGLPVVASSTGGLPESVIADRTGWLVPPGDVDALAGVLDRIAGQARQRPETFAELGRAGWQRVRERHTIRSMVEGVGAVYDRLDTRPTRSEARHQDC